MFLPLLCSSYHLNYHEIICYHDSVKDLVEKKFIEKMKESSHDNIQFTQLNNETIIHYTGKKFGYDYDATYNIYQDKQACHLYNNQECFQIKYKNRFLENFISLHRINASEIKIMIDLETYVPIPKRILCEIIKNKLNSIRP